MKAQPVDIWIDENGHGGSVLGRYGWWLGVRPGCPHTPKNVATKGLASTAARQHNPAATSCRIAQGDQGTSTIFKKPVLETPHGWR